MSSKLYLRLYLNLRKHQRTYWYGYFFHHILVLVSVKFLKLDYQDLRFHK
jgi:hypothetical protein